MFNTLGPGRTAELSASLDRQGPKEVYFRVVEPSFDCADALVSQESELEESLEEILQNLDQLW